MAEHRCPTPGCTPVVMDANRRQRRRFARQGTPSMQFVAHSDHCPFAGDNAVPGYRAAGKLRSPFGDDRG